MTIRVVKLKEMKIIPKWDISFPITMMSIGGGEVVKEGVSINACWVLSYDLHKITKHITWREKHKYNETWAQYIRVIPLGILNIIHYLIHPTQHMYHDQVQNRHRWKDRLYQHHNQNWALSFEIVCIHFYFFSIRKILYVQSLIHIHNIHIIDICKFIWQLENTSYTFK